MAEYTTNPKKESCVALRSKLTSAASSAGHFQMYASETPSHDSNLTAIATARRMVNRHFGFGYFTCDVLVVNATI